MSCQEMKHERLIHMQTSMDTEVHLGMIRVLTRSQEVEVSEVSEVSL